MSHQRRLALTLYVSGQGTSAGLALEALKDVCSVLPRGGWSLEVVDLLRQPERAIADRILVTPTLVRRSPLPVVVVVGVLTDRRRLSASLGLAGPSSPPPSGAGPAGG